MIEPSHLLQYVIRPTLATLAEVSGLPLASEAAERLLLATAAQESQCGRYLHQIGGPARGIYQIEPATYIDVIGRLDEKRWPKLRGVVLGLRNDALMPRNTQMEGNLLYATAVARANYWLVPEELPAADHKEGIWVYYKKYWNSALGAASREQFMRAWDEHVEDAVRA